jgi:hypothetical protein
MNVCAHFLATLCRAKNAYHGNRWGGLLRQTFAPVELGIKLSRSRLVVVDTVEAKAEFTSHCSAGDWLYSGESWEVAWRLSSSVGRNSTAVCASLQLLSLTS